MDLTYSRAEITLAMSGSQREKLAQSSAPGLELFSASYIIADCVSAFLSAAHLRLPRSRFVRRAHGVGRSVGLQKRSTRCLFVMA